MSGSTTTGSKADMLARLKAVLPTHWFPDGTPILDALLGGLAATASTLYAALAYVRLQTRVATVTDSFIDLAAADYCGSLIARRLGEADAAFRARLQLEILRPRNTYAALRAAVEDVTGRVPSIYEPTGPAGSGGYGIAMGYGAAGSLGGVNMPFQCLVNVYRPFAPNAPAWTGGPGPGAPAPGVPAPTTPVSDAEIYAAIAQVTPVAAVAWTSLQD